MRIRNSFLCNFTPPKRRFVKNEQQIFGALFKVGSENSIWATSACNHQVEFDGHICMPIIMLTLRDIIGMPSSCFHFGRHSRTSTCCHVVSSTLNRQTSHHAIMLTLTKYIYMLSCCEFDRRSIHVEFYSKLSCCEFDRHIGMLSSC